MPDSQNTVEQVTYDVWEISRTIDRLKAAPKHDIDANLSWLSDVSILLQNFVQTELKRHLPKSHVNVG